MSVTNYTVQWEPLIVFSLGQRETENISYMTTLAKPTK